MEDVKYRERRRAGKSINVEIIHESMSWLITSPKKLQRAENLVLPADKSLKI
jgi:hypothetical protein